MKIEIYTKDGCSYCVQAKEHIKNHGLEYIEYTLGVNATREDVQARVPEGVQVRQVPQIFIDDQYVGGYLNLLEWLLTRTQLKP